MLKKLLYKEAKLAANPLSFIFIAFAGMTMIPGYPILCGAFFICLGIFYTYQQLRENDDITYTVLLPVRKRDTVTAKFLFAVIIEAAGYLLFTLLTVVRLVFLAGAEAYTKNPMMNANAAFLGYTAMIFAAYNYFFIGGFFRTSYKIGKPFLIFSGVTLTIILIAEVLHHIPGLEMLNATAGINAPQLVILAAGVILYAAGTLCSYAVSVRRFEKTDL